MCSPFRTLSPSIFSQVQGSSDAVLDIMLETVAGIHCITEPPLTRPQITLPSMFPLTLTRIVLSRPLPHSIFTSILTPFVAGA